MPIVLAVGLVGLSPIAAAAQESPIGCGTVVTTDVRLEADLLDCRGAGLVVGASGVDIDLAGHVIDGTGIGSGIDNGAGHDRVRVTGGTVRDFQFGIHLFETSGFELHRVAVEANTIGAVVERSDAGELDRVSASGNDFTGIEVNFSEEIVVRRSTVADNGHGGITDRGSLNSTYLRNTITGNVAPGLDVWFSDGVVVARNHVEANDSTGILLTGITDGVVEGNAAVTNAGDGLSVEGPGNTLARNRAIENHGVGISAPEGTIDGGRNRASGNGGGDCVGVVCR
jgi:nitrous oxidase accessory protein NosD